MKQPRGIRVYCITPSSSGFGQWERTGGIAFAKRDDLIPRSDLDGLILDQNGMTPVTGFDCDGDPVVGITRHMKGGDK